MPQITVTNEEAAIIGAALDAAIASATRAQKTGKSPQIIEAYKLQQATLQELQAKVTKAAHGK